MSVGISNKTQLEELARFLRERTDLLAGSKFEQLYQEANDHDNDIGTNYDHFIVSTLTDLLYDSGVDPLPYLKEVPDYFAWELPIKSVNIPEGITTIGSYAFSDCTELTEIYLPNTVRFVRNSAFQSATNLRKIEFSDQLESLELEALFKCENLTEISLPKSLKVLGNAVFRNSGIENINYAGTFEEWLKLSRHRETALGIRQNMSLTCIDGTYTWLHLDGWV